MCKHIFAVVHGLVEYKTIKEVEHLPEEIHIKRGSKTAAAEDTTEAIAYQTSGYPTKKTITPFNLYFFVDRNGKA